MSISLTVETDITASQNLRKKIKNVQQIAQKAGRKAFQEIELPMVADLQFTPGAVKKPIDWQTEKQRKAFFATDGFGNGIPTVRNNAMVDAWSVEYKTSGQGWQIVVNNPVDYTRFVVGSLAKRVDRARRFQQRMHKATGWPLATETVQFWLGEAVEIFREQVLIDFGATDIQVTRQARTARRRN